IRDAVAEGTRDSGAPHRRPRKCRDRGPPGDQREDRAKSHVESLRQAWGLDTRPGDRLRPRSRVLRPPPFSDALTSALAVDAFRCRRRTRLVAGRVDLARRRTPVRRIPLLLERLARDERLRQVLRIIDLPRHRNPAVAVRLVMAAE